MLHRTGRSIHRSIESAQAAGLYTIAGAVIAAPRLAGIELKGTPALLSIVCDSIGAAEFIMRALTERYAVPRQRSGSDGTVLSEMATRVGI